MLVPELHDITSASNFDSSSFRLKSIFVPVLGSGGKVLHIVFLGTRLSFQRHAPSTLSLSNKHFSADSGMFLAIKCRSAVVSIDPPIQCVKFKLPLCTQFISYVTCRAKLFD